MINFTGFTAIGKFINSVQYAYLLKFVNSINFMIEVIVISFSLVVISVTFLLKLC